jgi:putative transposase
MPNQLSFRYFKTSPEIIQLAVMLYVRFPLSLRNVEDLLHERGVDVSYESIRYWWHRFATQFASEIQLLIFAAKDRFRDRFSKIAPQ